MNTVPLTGPPLAERQAALVAALVAGGPLPPGFDAGRVAATRRALLRKRATEAARVWPLLAASLGATWPQVFAAHRAGREPVGPLRDGWDVGRALRERGELTASAATELAERESRTHYDGRSAPRRRSLAERAVSALRRRARRHGVATTRVTEGDVGYATFEGSGDPGRGA